MLWFETAHYKGCKLFPSLLSPRCAIIIHTLRITNPPFYFYSLHLFSISSLPGCGNFSDLPLGLSSRPSKVLNVSCKNESLPRVRGVFIKSLQVLTKYCCRHWCSTALSYYGVKYDPRRRNWGVLPFGLLLEKGEGKLGRGAISKSGQDVKKSEHSGRNLLQYNSPLVTVQFTSSTRGSDSTPD